MAADVISQTFGGRVRESPTRTVEIFMGFVLFTQDTREATFFIPARFFAGSISELSVGGSTCVARVASPFARERGRVRIAPRDWRVCEARTPHLSPLPLARGEAEQTAVEVTINEHYVLCRENL